MGPVYFVVALMGCGDAEEMCREVRVAEARYATPAQCAAAIGPQLQANTDLAYPVVVGRCRPASTLMAARNKGTAG